MFCYHNNELTSLIFPLLYCKSPTDSWSHLSASHNSSPSKHFDTTSCCICATITSVSSSDLIQPSTQPSYRTTANFVLNLKPAQKEVLAPPLQTSANLLHQPNDFSITTPIQVHILANYLKNCDSFLANYLMEGFTFGFRIPYQGPRQFRKSLFYQG